MARSARGTADFAPFQSSERSGWIRVICSKPVESRKKLAIGLSEIFALTLANVRLREKLKDRPFVIR